MRNKLLIVIVVLCMSFSLAAQSQGIVSGGDQDRDRDRIQDCDGLNCTPDQDRDRIQDQDQIRDRNHTDQVYYSAQGLNSYVYSDEEWERITNVLRDQDSSLGDLDRIRDRLRDQNYSDGIQDQDRIRNRTQDCDEDCLYERDRDRERDQVKGAIFTVLKYENEFGSQGVKVSRAATTYYSSEEKMNTIEERMNERSRFTKFIAGGDQKSAREMEQEVVRTQNQIQELKQLHLNCNCSSETKQTIMNQIIVMEQDQYMHKINAEKEMNDKGLLGWLWK